MPKQEDSQIMVKTTNALSAKDDDLRLLAGSENHLLWPISFTD
jgi:hypothetical protein